MRACLALAVLLAAQPATAQRVSPSATTLTALSSYPIFFHLQAVVVAGDVQADGERVRLVPPRQKEPAIDVVWNAVQPPSGSLEVRGQFLDVGRLAPADPLTKMPALAELIQSRAPDRWPAHGELLVLVVSSVVPLAAPAAVPGIRGLALDPERYANRRVTLTGQFAGRNLFGDVPRAPGTSRYEFVVRAGGAAVWVTGVPPQGKGWVLDPDSRLDTNVWLRVTGTVRASGGIVRIEAAAIERAAPEAEAPDTAPVPVAAPSLPPRVMFSLPAAGETDVAPSAVVKFQLSADLDAASLAGHIAVNYVGESAGAAAVAFTARWDRSARVLELTFEKPLDRFRSVRIELRDGIKGADGQAMTPFTLTFSVGERQLAAISCPTARS